MGVTISEIRRDPEDATAKSLLNFSSGANPNGSWCVSTVAYCFFSVVASKFPMNDTLFPPDPGPTDPEPVPTPRPRPAAPPRLRRPERAPMELRCLSLEQLLPADHPARAVWDFVQGLDLSGLYAAIKAVEGHAGNTPIDPRLLFALWLYATVDGVGSAGELDRLCTEHIAYQWLCGGVSVNYHTLADFRVGHAELLNARLTDSVAVLIDQQLVTLQTVAQDGMRVRASAGADTFRRKPTLQRRLEEAQAHVQALARQTEDDAVAVSRRQQAARQRAAQEKVQRLRQALAQMPQLQASREAYRKGTAAKARASATDPEARQMKMANGGFNPAFNVQFTTDVASGVIVDTTVVNQGADNGQMGPSRERIERRYGQASAQMVVDSGFASKQDIAAAAAAGTEVYMPVKNEEKLLAEGKDPYQAKPGDAPAVAAWRQRMGTEAAKALYRVRCATAEWVNAGCRNRGLQQFRVRGVAKALACVLWQVLAHNLLRGLYGQQQRETAKAEVRHPG